MEPRELELEIALSPSQVDPVKRWVEVFAVHEPNWGVYPVVEGTRLRLIAPSFPFLLAYADPKDSNEFDLRRLQALGRAEIERRLELSTSPLARRCFRKALDNLKDIDIGEFASAVEEAPL